jgi:alkyl hydroperoxide reductase subunit AhpC
MSVQLGEQVPDFTAETTQGTINFHDWIGDGWAVLFSHPKDFTPVCTTELGSVAGLQPEFEKRNCKIIGLSVDSVSDHAAWSKDIEETSGNAVGFPLIGDTDLAVAKRFGMLQASATGSAGERTAGDNATVRKLFIIGPDKMVKLTLTYPMTTGRNFHEVLRVLDSIQLTADHKVATPADWKQGEDVIIVPSVSNEEAEEKYPQGWSTPKPYIRMVAQPNLEEQSAGGSD